MEKYNVPHTDKYRIDEDNRLIARDIVVNGGEAWRKGSIRRRSKSDFTSKISNSSCFPLWGMLSRETGEVADEVWRKGGVRRRGEVDFTSRASKRRERAYFFINSDKFLSLNDLYRLGFASLSEPLSPRGKARESFLRFIRFRFILFA